MSHQDSSLRALGRPEGPVTWPWDFAPRVQQVVLAATAQLPQAPLFFLPARPAMVPKGAHLDSGLGPPSSSASSHLHLGGPSRGELGPCAQPSQATP